MKRRPIPTVNCDEIISFRDYGWEDVSLSAWESLAVPQSGAAMRDNWPPAAEPYARD